MKRREYKSGTQWCVWQWKDIILNGELYLRRLHIVQTPWFSILLHWILRPDSQRHMHDHPVSFLSIVLWGGYMEERPNSTYRMIHKTYRMIRRVNFKRATGVHRIIEVLPHTLTLVFAGPREREWGFHTPAGWVHWKEYVDDPVFLKGR